MERKKFITVIRIPNGLDESMILGQIFGVEYAMCKQGDKHYCHLITDKEDNIHIISESTEAQYHKFTEIIEELHPGLCTFDV